MLKFQKFFSPSKSTISRLPYRHFSSQSQSTLSEEHIRRHIDFTSVDWPEVNPVDYRISAKNGEEIRIQNYRYPAIDPANRKGIVQLIHGYGDYIGRYAWLGKRIAERGYDCVGMD